MLRPKRPAGTLGALLEQGGGYFIQCEACLHFKRLDSYAIAKREGWGVSVAELTKRFKCGRCGKRNASIRRE